jgi:hypothetical protein
MILCGDSHALYPGIGAWAFGDRPGFEGASYFEPEIVMEVGGMVFLNYKDRQFTRFFCSAAGFRGFIEIPLILVGSARHID